jgi:hypothetical protein
MRGLVRPESLITMREHQLFFGVEVQLGKVNQG